MHFLYKRREFITMLGSAAAWPMAARAQQPALPTVGWLSSETPEGGYGLMAAAFRQGLSEAGFVEGRGVAIEYRWAQGQIDRLPALAAKAATTTIPIVFSTAADPVAEGLVASLSRPGGNATGVTNLGTELMQKLIEKLHEMVPTATVVGALVDPSDRAIAEPATKDVQAAGRALGLQIHILHASAPRDIDAAFATLVKVGAGGLVIAPHAFLFSRRGQIAALALRHAIPAIYYNRDFPAAGGLMSYGPSITDGYRQAGTYAGRILKGERPSELPVQQSAKFELTINLNTAKALGLDEPFNLQQLADEVIE